MENKKIKELTQKEYREYIEKKSPKSKLLRNTIRAFIVGGAICVIGQFINSYFRSRGMDNDIAGSLTSITMIFLGALFTGLNIYDDLGKFAGAGSIVPITGFANSIVSPAMEFKNEGYVMGVGAKMFIVAGPVLVYGISVSIITGIVYYLLK